MSDPRYVDYVRQNIGKHSVESIKQGLLNGRASVVTGIVLSAMRVKDK